MDAFLTPLLDWIAAHPAWAGAVVFAVAFAESLALVGLFMPGALLMFAIGALVGTGTLALWPTLAFAAAGAIAGDGVSFWLGRHYHQRLRTLWPLRTHPETVARATDLFYRHGGKAVLFGRFVGPLRPVVPAVAGMLEMPLGRFLAVNILSGLLWAPAYLLPGVVFGASLGLAAQVATRLAVLVVLLLALLIFIGWLVHRLFNLLHPRTGRMIAAILEWSRLHPRAGQLPAALLDPDQPETRGLTLAALLLLGATTGFLALLPNVSGGGLLENLDAWLYFLLQEMRTPWMDRSMIAVTELGDGRVMAALFAAVLAWLLLKGHTRAAVHWGVAVAFMVALTYLLKFTTGVARPIPLYDGAGSFSFPSAHATYSTVVFGFLAVLIGREVDATRRWLTYATVTIGVAAIAFSRLYLGAHWLSDVLGGVALGLAWVSLIGIAYRRHPATPLLPGMLASVALITLVIAGGWNMAAHFERDLLRYAPQRLVQTFPANHWWEGGWAALPERRDDLLRDRAHPLTFQYTGAAELLARHLRENGWRDPVPLDGKSWLRWLAVEQPGTDVPFPPQVHDGHNERLLLLRPTPQGLWVLRLWPTDILLSPGDAPLWVGNVAQTELHSPLGVLAIPRTADGFTEGLRQLRADLAAAEAFDLRLAERREHRLLLIRPRLPE